MIEKFEPQTRNHPISCLKVTKTWKQKWILSLFFFDFNGNKKLGENKMELRKCKKERALGVHDGKGKGIE